MLVSKLLWFGKRGVSRSRQAAKHVVTIVAACAAMYTHTNEIVIGKHDASEPDLHVDG